MMSEKEFSETLQGSVHEMLGNSYAVRVHEVEKVNIGRQYSLVICDNGDCAIAPSIYLGKFYRDYLDKGIGISEIADKVIDFYNHLGFQPGTKAEIAENMNDRGWVEDHLFFRLVNTKKNEGLLKSSICVDVLDLSLVLYVVVSESDGKVGSARVTDGLFEGLNLEREGLTERVLQNTRKIFPESLMGISSVLAEVGGPQLGLPKGKLPFEPLVLSNEPRVNGATAIYYPGLLKEIAKGKGKNLFVLPSSIHECILMEERTGLDSLSLRNMVQEVNREAVQEEEVLSDNVYYYDLGKDILSIV